MAEGFLMSIDAALLFFRYCRMFKLEDYKQRLEVMRRITAKHKAKYIRNPDEFLQGKRVLKLQ